MESARHPVSQLARHPVQLAIRAAKTNRLFVHTMRNCYQSVYLEDNLSGFVVRDQLADPFVGSMGLP